MRLILLGKATAVTFGARQGILASMADANILAFHGLVT